MVDARFSDTAVIAHRGFAARFPENTLAAFRGAGRIGADGVELDVRQCGTGEAVVIHDATVDRVTDGTGRVGDLPLSALTGLDVLGSGETIPTLPAAVDAVPADVTLHVELKDPGPIPAVVALADDRPQDVVVSSFDPDHLDRVRDLDGPPTAFLFAENPDRNRSLATDLGCSFVHPHASLCLGTDLIERAHEADLGVNAWTLGPPGSDGTWVVTDPDAPTRLRERGVDGLIADAPV
ncbi:MAG: glycerophosphodiester phosphodiesterase [Halobacteriales archaeon]